MKSVPSENILKLRELTNKLIDKNINDEYKDIVIQLKKIVDEGKHKLEHTESAQSKIKCYETMCSTITNLLTNIKYI